MSLVESTRPTRQTSSAWEELMSPIRPSRPITRETRIVLLVLILLGIWGLAILAFGVPALVWPMKLIVPGMILGLVAITWSM